MNTRLLKILADFLDSDAVAPEKFNLGTWIDEDIEAETFPELELKLKDSEIDCGYTACAIGWACTLPEFKEAGLRFDLGLNVPYVESEGEPQSGADWTSIAPLAKLFDTTTENITWLFLPQFYDETEENPITPKFVAERIRDLITEYELEQEL